tara:strand:+ start:5104 stop:6582 length:1479 start_codon:yes stop_codon:yes gene_type:complete
MADIFQLGNLGVADDNASTTSTGNLRRKYNFGSRVSELAIAQDPFFRMVSKVAKKPTDDPEFKFTERRPSFHKRYAYAWGAHDTAAPSAGGVLTANTTKVVMATDYKSAGNKGSVYGATAIEVGSTGTKPEFFVPGQLVKIPTAATLGAAYADYAIFKVDKVEDSAQANMKLLTGSMVKTPSSLHQAYKHADDKGRGNESQEALSQLRSFVIGTAHAQGSGYPESWKDQPFSTGIGNTQIWKTAMAMDNTTRATVLKYDASEWGRVWKEKLIEHKWDIEQSLLFNTAANKSGDAWYTDGVISYISGFGNQFSLPLATKSQDDFLDDLSAFLDPRYNNAAMTLFFVNTATYNWLHKLSGYFANNMGQVQPYTGGSATKTAAGGGNSLARADMAMVGKKKVFGVDISVITTPYGDMHVARNIHLDQTSINMLGVNMKYVSYRPLVGNGLARDTSIYVGVQTLENSGVDRRVDLIQTEAGLEIHMPEAHGIWTSS